MTKRFLSIAVILALMITSLAGCGDGTRTGKSQKVFRFAVSTEPELFDPTRCNSITDNNTQHALTESLTRTTGGNVTSGIAESWEVSKDGKVYTFHLRDANWSDGVPITANDFVYSWRRLADPATESEYGFAIWMIEGGREVNLEGADPDTLGVKAIDDKTLEVRLVNPTSYFLGYIGNQSCFAPLRQDVVEKYGSEFATDADKNVYSGPYVLDSHHDNVWIFRKNPAYWDAESIKLDGAEMYYVRDSQTQIEMYERGELDFASIPTVKVPDYRDREDANHYLNGNVDFCYINPDSDNKILGDRDFRLALNYSINRIDFNHYANDNAYKPYGAIVFPGLSGRDVVTYGEVYDVDSYAYPLDGDIDLARFHLDEAMKRLEIDDPGDITVELLIQEAETSEATVAELKRQWEDVLKINVKPRMVPRADLYSKYLPQGDFEIAFSGWIADYNDPYTFLELFTTENTSYSPYSNPDFDELLDKSVTEANSRKRMEMLNQAEQMLIADGACIPLQCKDIYYLLNPDVSYLTLSFSNITVDWVFAAKNEE